MAKSGELEISVVVPAYNEEARLRATLPRLYKALKIRFRAFEVIVVDDGSTDDTSGVVERFSREHPEVRLMRYEPNRGKGRAVRTGMLAAGGKYILMSDADLSTPVREVRKLLAAIEEGYDIAIGSRAVKDSRILEHQPFHRVLLGKTFNKIVRLLLVRGIADTQCGFKLFTEASARRIFPQCRLDGFSFDVEVLYRARTLGLSVKEVGVIWINSPESKVSPLPHSIEILRDLLSLSVTALFDRGR